MRSNIYLPQEITIENYGVFCNEVEELKLELRAYEVINK